MKQHQAIFLSRTSAHHALIREGRKYGLTPEVIAKTGKAIPVSKRGEHLGYAAILPQLPAGSVVEDANP